MMGAYRWFMDRSIHKWIDELVEGKINSLMNARVGGSEKTPLEQRIEEW